MAARLTALRLAGRLTPISSTCPSRCTVMGSINVTPRVGRCGRQSGYTGRPAMNPTSTGHRRCSLRTRTITSAPCHTIRRPACIPWPGAPARLMRIWCPAVITLDRGPVVRCGPPPEQWFHLRRLSRIEVHVLLDHMVYAAPDLKQPEPSMPRPFGVDGVSHGGLVSWALACDDIDAAVAAARSHGYDPGDVVHAQRAGPTGTVLRWRLTLNAMTGGLIPFLISWGDTQHPARSAPHGLTLRAFHIEHPDPPSLAPLLTALGADVEIRPAATATLVARLSGPNGSQVLR